MIKRILKTVLLIALIPGLYVVGVLIYGSLNDWQPEKRTELALYHQTALESPTVEQSFELLIWNIGFGGLGEESDFFYDGGKAVHQPEATVVKNEEGILKTLKEIGVVDMYLFHWRVTIIVWLTTTRLTLFHFHSQILWVKSIQELPPLADLN